MGVALADEAAGRGAEVVLVLGPCGSHPDNPMVKIINVESAIEMLSACENEFPDSDIAIMAAAVADYAPAHPVSRKIKREHSRIPTLELVKNPDIAAHLGNSKQPGQILVGFALETDNAEVNAREKLLRKNLDMVVVNSLEDEGAGFGTDTNRISIIRAGGEMRKFSLKPKRKVASDILDEIVIF